MAYKASVCFAPAGIDACAAWRMWMPHLNIPHSRFLFTEGVPDINEMSECDVVVVQRLMTQQNVEFLRLARMHGLRIIYDLDDDVWDMPDSNPAKRFFGRSDILKGLEACAEWADAITVSTRQLKRVVESRFGHLLNAATKKEIPVVHIDNCVDLTLFRKPFIPKDADKVVIGWGGSNTHAGDVERVWNLLPQIIKEFDNVYLEIVGEDVPIQLRDHPRVKAIPWCHIAQFHNRYATWNWDIVLAPLEQHKFNKAKSSIKMIEAGCIGAPCLAQDIAPYEYFCSFDYKLKWLLCLDFDWKRKLCQLIQSKAMREDYGNLMYENVVKNFNIQRTATQWRDLAQNIIS